MAVLKLLAPDGRVLEVFQLDKPRIVLGREHDVDIALTDPSVSRHHAMVVESPRGWLAIAMETPNGLRVGGQLVKQAELAEGAILELGQTRLQFSKGDVRTAPTVALAAWQTTEPAFGVAPAQPQAPTPAPYAPQPGYAAASGPGFAAPAAPAAPPRSRIGCFVAAVVACGVVSIGGVIAGGVYYFWEDLSLGELLTPAGSSSAAAPPTGTPLVSGPGPGDGVGVAGALFEVDTQQAEFPLDVHGGSGVELAGKLADASGRRTVVFRPRGGAEEVVFPAAWNLPAVAAVGSDGSVLVCGNALTGAPSSLTTGGLPDPRSGVALTCRLRRSGGWDAPAAPASGSEAHWLVDVTPSSDGFEVLYSRDQSRLLMGQPSPGDGLFRVRFSRGAFGQPELVENYDPPFRPVR
jgi:hypothetical protein